MQKLFSCLFGSRLYGTQTPSSDRDIKHIILPDLNQLLLGRSVENKVKKTNNEHNVRNNADDVDEEFIPLQVFAKHFIEGQTYAIEMAFAIDGIHAEQTFWSYDPTDPSYIQSSFNEIVKSRVESAQVSEILSYHNFYKFTKELRENFLTSNIKAMMGYVVNQASLYSFKGERLNVTRELNALITEVDLYYKSDSTTLSVIDEAPHWVPYVDKLAAKYPKYFRRDVYDIGGGRMKPCLIILEKTLPYTNTIPQTLKVLDSLEKKYGSRADQASANNVDWKATMHAIRIVDEGLELLSTKRLSFPLSKEKVEYLLSVKRGEVPIEKIKDELEEKLNRLKELSASTDLPECDEKFKKSFDEWLITKLRDFYEIGGSIHELPAV